MSGGGVHVCLAGLLLVLAAGLGGCGAADRPAADNHGYGWEYDQTGASGLRLRYEEAVASDDRAALQVFEAAFGRVEACLGIAAGGPLVVVVPRGALDGRSGVTPAPGYHVGGLYYFDTDLVVVTESLYALRHELVHYLLDQAGFPVQLNRAHEHAGFANCTGPAYL
jgi:hypothetical protein